MGYYLTLASALAAAIALLVVLAKSREADDPKWRHAAMARGFLLAAGVAYVLLACRATVMVFREVFSCWPK